jgi:small subunit ribosomal protein S4e
MAHLKRYAMPDFWPARKKERKWIIRPSPGPHAVRRCVALQIMLRDMLGYARNSGEVKKILNRNCVMVDRKVRKDPGYPAGLMDVIEIPEAKKHFRMTMGRHGLELTDITEAEAASKICRIERKIRVKGGMTQLSLHDGRNILVKGKNDYSAGDSLVIGLPGQKILEHVKMEKGAKVMVIAGKNVGATGSVAEIKKRKTMLEKSIVKLKHSKSEIETPLAYVFVMDGGKA